MKAHLLLPIMLLLAVALPTQGRSFKLDAPELTTVLNLASADHLLLVGFPDQSIGRIQGTSATAYRRRGGYQGSSWSQRIARSDC